MYFYNILLLSFIICLYLNISDTTPIALPNQIAHFEYIILKNIKSKPLDLLNASCEQIFTSLQSLNPCTEPVQLEITFYEERGMRPMFIHKRYHRKLS